MKSILFMVMFIVTTYGFSQSYFGYETDNYSGIHSVLVNPANIADSRLKADINLITVGSTLANDYVSLSIGTITQLLDGVDFTDLNTFASNENTVLGTVDVLGPSFMFNLSEKHSIGLISRARVLVNVNGINGSLFESLIDGFPADDFSFEQNNLDATAHAWGEIGLSYGRVLLDDYDKHYLKAGVTLKYLAGVGIAQRSSNTLSGNFSAANNQVSFNGDVSSLISYDDSEDLAEVLQDLTPGFGADIGVVYEYRTRSSRLADRDSDPRAINQYRAKIGVSVLDIGAITYKDQLLQKFTANVNLNANDVEEDFLEAFENSFAQDSIRGDVTVALPTTLKLNVDYKITHLVYANLDINQTLVNSDNLFNNNGLNHITFTPRFETRVFSAYLPVTYSTLSKTMVGAGLKLGPIVIGSGTILSNLLTDNSQLFNFYFGTKIQLKHSRR